MKNVLLVLVLFGWNSVAGQQHPMAAALADEIAGYVATETIRIDTLDDGAVKVARYYAGGQSSMEVRITRLVSIQKEELPKQVQRLKETFMQMAREGRMEAEVQESANLTGILTFYEGTAGAILIFKGSFLVEFQLSGVAGLVVSRKVLKSLNLEAL